MVNQIMSKRSETFHIVSNVHKGLESHKLDDK